MGLKLYFVTETSSGYPLLADVYFEKKPSRQASEFGHSYNVVKELLTHANSLNKGYHRYDVDNFYTSPVLAEHFLTPKTLLTGSLRSNRKGVPLMPKSAKPKVGKFFYATKDPLLAFSWKGKEKEFQRSPCLMLTTGIDAGMVKRIRRNGQTKELSKAISS